MPDWIRSRDIHLVSPFKQELMFATLGDEEIRRADPKSLMSGTPESLTRMFSCGEAQIVL